MGGADSIMESSSSESICEGFRCVGEGGVFSVSEESPGRAIVRGGHAKAVHMSVCLHG